MKSDGKTRFSIDGKVSTGSEISGFQHDNPTLLCVTTLVLNCFTPWGDWGLGLTPLGGL